jgi:YesN/AraC family two-component response regulator
MQRVLVIDDDQGTVETFAFILRLEGFDVSTAQTGAAALDLLRSESHDVVLADLQLPDMTGLDVLRTLHRSKPHVPCVIMTAFGTVASTVEAMRLGAQDFVEKPLTEVDVVRIVRHATEHSSRLDVGDPATIDWRVVETTRAIELHFREPNLRLYAIAKQLEVSIEHLCRLLKRDTGDGFNDHLNRRRIEEAKHLLADTPMSVKEIAYEVGYRTTSRLGQHFKRLCGRQPTKFRREIRANIGR